MQRAVVYNPELLSRLCREYHVARLALFGSVLRGEETPESDLDLLVEFQKEKTPGLKFFRLERELSALFERKVDLNTAGFLSKGFRDEVVSSAKNLYVA